MGSIFYVARNEEEEERMKLDSFVLMVENYLYYLQMRFFFSTLWWKRGGFFNHSPIYNCSQRHAFQCGGDEDRNIVEGYNCSM